MGDGKSKEDTRAPPLSDALSKFREIKDKRFQPKDKSKRGYFNAETATNTEPSAGQPPVILLDGALATSEDEQDVSSDVTASTDAHLQPPAVNTRRRVSMPSVFHPLQPLTTRHTGSTDSLDGSVTVTPDDGLIVPTQNRRASVPMVLQAYSNGKVPEMEKLDTSLDNLIIDTGDRPANAMHAFYNLWECGGDRSRSPHTGVPKH